MPRGRAAAPAEREAEAGQPDRDAPPDDGDT